MQKIKVDFDNPGLPQHISAVENDSQSRFFEAALYENGKAYTAPEGATYSIMYRGFGPQNQGWYDTINDGAGKRAACAVSGNVVTCEIARQALQVPGHVSIVLCVTTGKGYMLKSWPIECDCKNDRYDSTVEIQSFFYVTQISNADWTQAIQAWENLKDAIDPTLSVSGKAADAAKVGEAVNAEATRAKGVEGQLKEDKVNKPSAADDGKVPRAKDGEVEWVDIGQPTDGQTDSAVAKWLNAHPEATTTVLDGSIDESKIFDDFLLHIKNDYVIPQMFGAKGDGETDDTVAIENAINNSENKPVYFPSSTYLVSRKLNILDNTVIKGYRIFGNKINRPVIKFVPKIKDEQLIHIYKKTGGRGFLSQGYYHENIIFDFSSDNLGGITFGLWKPSDESFRGNAVNIDEWGTTTDGGEQFYIEMVNFDNCSFGGKLVHNLPDDGTQTQILLTRIKCFSSKVVNTNFRGGVIGNLMYGCDHPYNANNSYSINTIGSYMYASGTFGVEYVEKDAWMGGHLECAIAMKNIVHAVIDGCRVESSGSTSQNYKRETFVGNVEKDTKIITSNSIPYFRQKITVFYFWYNDKKVYVTLKRDGDNVIINSDVSFDKNLENVVFTKEVYGGFYLTDGITRKLIRSSCYCTLPVVIESNTYENGIISISNVETDNSILDTTKTKNIIYCGNTVWKIKAQISNSLCGDFRNHGIGNYHPNIFNLQYLVFPSNEEYLEVRNAEFRTEIIEVSDETLSANQNFGKIFYGARIQNTRGTGNNALSIFLNSFRGNGTLKISFWVYNPNLVNNKIIIGNYFGTFGEVALTGKKYEQIELTKQTNVFGFDTPNVNNPNSYNLLIYNYEILSSEDREKFRVYFMGGKIELIN